MQVVTGNSCENSAVFCLTFLKLTTSKLHTQRSTRRLACTLQVETLHMNSQPSVTGTGDARHPIRDSTLRGEHIMLRICNYLTKTCELCTHDFWPRSLSYPWLGHCVYISHVLTISEMVQAPSNSLGPYHIRDGPGPFHLPGWAPQASCPANVA